MPVFRIRCQNVPIVTAGSLLLTKKGQIAGYATVLAKVHSGSLDDGDLEYAYLADLVVRATYRGRGLGRELIAKAETYARDEGAKLLRVCVLAKTKARGAYTVDQDFPN